MNSNLVNRTVLVWALLVTAFLLMGIGNVFQAGDVISSAAVNENFAELETAIADLRQSTQAAAPGAWTAYTPNGFWTAGITYSGQWRKAGPGTVDLRITVNAIAPAPSTGLEWVSLPGGLTLDTSKLAPAAWTPAGLVSVHFPDIGTGALGPPDTMTSGNTRVYLDPSQTGRLVLMPVPFALGSIGAVQIMANSVPVSGL